MNTQLRQNSLQYLSSMCSDNSNLHTKIAATLFCHKYSQIFEIIILTLEYVQLISQGLLLAPGMVDDFYYNENPIFKLLVYFARLFDLGYWLYSYTYEIFTLVMLIVFGLITVSKYFFYFYICLSVSQKIKVWAPLLDVWRILYKAQSRVLCYFMTSVWVHTLIAVIQNDEGVLHISKGIMITVSVIMMGLEYTFAFFLQNYYCFVLPSKSFLASRDNYLEIITLSQKFIGQTLQVALPTTLKSRYWILTGIGLFYSVIRDLTFFQRLPYYNFQAIIWQDRILIVGLSLNVTSFVGGVLYTANVANSWSFSIVAWMVIGTLLYRFTTNYFNRIQFNILNDRKQDKPRLLIFKMQTLVKFIKITKAPKKHVKKYSFASLMNTSAFANIESVLDLVLDDKDSLKSDLTSKESRIKVISQHLQDLCLKYPKNDLIKLYTAYFYITKSQMLSAAMKMTSDLQKSGSLIVSLNASLLRYEMEARIEKGYKECVRPLNIHKYLQSRSQVAHLEQNVLEQIDIQQKLYNEVIADMPDLAKIFNYSQLIHKKRQVINGEVKAMFDRIPEYYIRPLAICTLYHSLVTFSVDDYLYYRKRYTQAYKKYERFYKSDKLCEENMFQDANFLMVISIQNQESGKICFATKSIENVYGKNIFSYLVKDGKSLCLPSFTAQQTKFYEYQEVKGPHSLPDVISRTFGYHPDGYVVPLNTASNLHPYCGQGLFIDSIVRQPPTNKEFMLLLENGDIEGATCKLAKRLGLLRPKIYGEVVNHANVKDISHDLYEINEAFNIVNASKSNNNVKEKKSHSIVNGDKIQESTIMDLLKAQNIHSIYSSNGKTITFSVSNQKRGHNYQASYSYHCTVIEIFLGPVYLKQVILDLDEIEGSNQDNSNEYSKEPTEKLLAEVDAKDSSSSESENYQSQLPEGNSKIAEFEDEKENGWIDFSLLKSKDLQRVTSSTRQENNITSPLALESLITTSRGPLISERKVTNFHKPRHSKFNIVRPATTRGEREEREDMKEDIQIKKNNGLIYQEHSIASVTSKKSRQQKISRAFKQALGKRHVPIIFKAITLIFYLLFVAIFITQLIFKIRLDSAIQNLNIGKDILSLTSQRSYYLSNVQIFTRMTWDTAIQRLLPSDFGMYYTLPLNAVSSVRNNALLLSQTNTNFFSNTDSLYSGLQQSIFAKDVKLIDTDTDNSTTYLTNFQAVERLVETALYMAKLMNQNNTVQAESSVKFLLHNTLNDVYIKNEDISNSLIDFFGDERDGIYTNITVSVVITSILSGGIILVLTMITWGKYKEEKLNMSAVTKISSQGIQNALNNIKNLKMAIESESSFDDNRQNTEFHEPVKNPAMDAAKKERDRTLNSQGIFRRYLFYIGRAWIFTAMIAIIAVVNCAVGKMSLDYFSDKTAQLILIGRIKSTISITAAVHHELFGNNGTTEIHDTPTPSYMQITAANLDALKNQLSSTFMMDDSTYDSTIAEILFSNGCPFIADPSYESICYQLQIRSNRGSLLYLLTDYSNIMSVQSYNYEHSNKTIQALVSLEMWEIEDVISDFALATDMCDAVSSVIDEEFGSEMTRTSQQRKTIFIFLLFALIILSVLVWIYVLHRLVDYSQQFKIVLSVFPPDLVLSNFVLKTFLMKTSQGALSSIKNDI